MCYNALVKKLRDFKTNDPNENHEEVIAMAKAVVDQDVCVGCESCVGACPVGAIAVDGGKAAVNADACVECGTCVGTCPVGAISQ